jgi:hypothetical protein
MREAVDGMGIVRGEVGKRKKINRKQKERMGSWTGGLEVDGYAG